MGTHVAPLLLLYNETVVHSRDPLSGETILHFAARRGSPPLIRRLISNAEDLLVRDGEGRTPLHTAASYQTSCLDSITEICKAISRGNIRLDTILDAQNTNALHVAVSPGNHDHARALIKHGFDPSFFVDEPQPGVDPVFSVTGSPLFLAALKGDEGMVKIILKNSVDHPSLANWIHSRGRSLLRHSVYSQKPKIAEILLCNGADWHEMESDRDELLAFANSGRTPVMLLLLVAEGCLPMNSPLDVSSSMRRFLSVYDEDLFKPRANLATQAFWFLEQQQSKLQTDLRSVQIYTQRAILIGRSFIMDTTPLTDVLGQEFGLTSSKLPVQDSGAGPAERRNHPPWTIDQLKWF